MYQILCVLMATIACGIAVGHCQTPRASTTTITFQSSTHSDFHKLLAREAATGTVAVHASLGFPEETSEISNRTRYLHFVSANDFNASSWNRGVRNGKENSESEIEIVGCR
jgi:hypothetical protein